MTDEERRLREEADDELRDALEILEAEHQEMMREEREAEYELLDLGDDR